MRRVLKLIAVNAVLTVVLLAAIEGASRWLAPTALAQPLMAAENEKWVTEREFHPQLFWRLTPRLGPNGEVVINELGLRGPLPGPKVAGELRILSLGESTTAAMRLPLEETYTKVMERSLAPVDGRRVVAINAGTGGYTLAQGVSFMRLHGLELEPDVVLTYFGYNDFIRASFRVERDGRSSADAVGLTDLELQRQRRRPVTRLMLWLERHSNFVRYAVAPEVATEVRRGGRRRVPAEDRLELYRELAELCTERDIRLVVLVPMYRSFTRHQPFLRRLATDHGFEVLDLPARLDAMLEERGPFFFDPVHPRAELHRLIGEELAHYLQGASV